MPRLVSCGGRQATFEDFVTAHGRSGGSEFVAMLIDSEEPPADPLSPWQHLRDRDGWGKPADAGDDQVLLMVTCMETWIITDRAALDDHYGNKLQKSALPPLTNPEKLTRDVVQEKLTHATRKCSNAYQEGKRSFEVLAKLDPGVLTKHLRSVVRVYEILDQHL